MGFFAVAMTLLVLDLRVPARDIIHSENDLLITLLTLTPRLLVYLMSFLTLGIFWVGQQTQLNFIAHGNRHFTWLQLAFLFAISLMPFSTSLMAEFIAFRTALLIYWGNIFLLGAFLFISWKYAFYAKLVIEEAPKDLGKYVERHITLPKRFMQ